MKRSTSLIFFVFIIVVITAVWFLVTRPKQEQPATQGMAIGCDQTLWNHVYKPLRLHVIDLCKTVSGTIISSQKEPDGDLHIRLKLDPQYESLLNQKNIDKQQGGLVLEPVCKGPVTQPDAQQACAGYTSTIAVPPAGVHVTVTGSYVLDLDHGWNEIHPVSQITQN